jgi:hypothetical protein
VAQRVAAHCCADPVAALELRCLRSSDESDADAAALGGVAIDASTAACWAVCAAGGSAAGRATAALSALRPAASWVARVYFANAFDTEDDGGGGGGGGGHVVGLWVLPALMNHSQRQQNVAFRMTRRDDDDAAAADSAVTFSAVAAAAVAAGDELFDVYFDAAADRDTTTWRRRGIVE